MNPSLDIKKICEDVENIMKLEVDAKLKSGQINFEQSTVQEFLDHWKEETLSCCPDSGKAKYKEVFDFYKTISPDSLVELLRGNITLKHWPVKADLLKELGRMYLMSNSALGYYIPDQNNFRIIEGNIGLIMWVAQRKKLNFSKDDLLESVIAHELAHKTHGDHYPGVFKEHKKREADVLSLNLSMDSTTYQNYGLVTKAKIQLELKKRKDLSFGVQAYVEGVGQYVQEEFGKLKGKEVISSMENSKGFFEAKFERLIIKMLEIENLVDSYKKGCAFLRYIDERTGQNPLVFTYKRPPESREEIEKPWKYFKRI